jgi:PAS domain S-box-containing protein
MRVSSLTSIIVPENLLVLHSRTKEGVMAEQQREETRLSSPRRVTPTGLAELLDLSPDALVVVDQAGMIVQANAQAAAFFGYQLQEVLEQPLEVLLPERLRAVHAAHRQHYFTSPTARAMGTHLELVGRRRDGSEFPVDISLRPARLGETLLAIGAVRDMSEQRHAERELAQLAERLHLQAELIELSHDANLLRDPTSRVIFWNKGAEELYGWTEEEALGRITHSLLQTRFPVSLAQVDGQLEREGRWEGELVHTCRDGSAVMVESRQALMRGAREYPTAILEINRDITQRRQLEQQEQAAHAEIGARLAFLQQLLDALPSSVYLVSGPDARLRLSNRAADSLWGAAWHLDQPMQEFLETRGISVLGMHGRPLLPEELATLRAVRQGETVIHQQEIIRRPNRSLLPVLVTAIVLDPAADWMALRGKAEPALPSSRHEAREAVALVVHQDVSALKQAEYLKDEFIGLAAHELRNPLGALRGFASMLGYQTARGRGARLADWQQEALCEIEQATARLDKLTEDLLDVTRLQAGRLVLSRKPADMVVLVRSLVMQAQITTRRHTFSFETPLSRLVVEVDRVRIEQVLSNLLGNAVKYSPQGGPIEVVLS